MRTIPLTDHVRRWQAQAARRPAMSHAEFLRHAVAGLLALLEAKAGR